MTIRELIEDLEEIAEYEGDDAQIVNINNTPIEEAVEMFDGNVMLVTSTEYVKLLKNNFNS